MADDLDEKHVRFSVVELGAGTLIGAAVLWGIANHNRSAHMGLGLLPSSRGEGYGTDGVAVLCHYGFVVRGLQRLQIETLSDDTAMLRGLGTGRVPGRGGAGAPRPGMEAGPEGLAEEAPGPGGYSSAAAKGVSG